MKANFILLSLLYSMTACVYNEELAEVADLCQTKQANSLTFSMQQSINIGETNSSQSIPNEAFAHVQICIKNEMPNLNLIVQGIRLCNIHLSGTYYFTENYWETDTALSTLSIETGELELKPNEEIMFPQKGNILFIPQSVRAWNPSVLPQQSQGCYLLLNCIVSNGVTIWGDEKGKSAEVAIPLSVCFQNNQSSVIVLTLAPNCPWYDVYGSRPQLLFVPITFDVTVDEWEE